MAQILVRRAEQDLRHLRTMGLEELFARSVAGQRKFQSAIDFLKHAIRKRRNKKHKDPIILNLEKVLQTVKVEQEARRWCG